MNFVIKKAVNLSKKTDDMRKELDSNKHKKVIIYQIWETFCLKTNAHGFFKVAEDTKVMRLVWILIMCLTLMGFFALIFALLQQLLSNNLNAEVEIVPSNVFTMPDVTVCPRQRFFFYDQQITKFSFTPSQAILDNNISFQQYFTQSVNIWSSLGFASDAPRLSRYSILQKSQRANLLRGQFDILIKLNYMKNNISSDAYTPLLRPDGFRCVTYRPQNRQIISFDEVPNLFLVPFIPTIGNDDSYESLVQTSSELESLRVGVSIFIHPPMTMPEFETQELIIPRDYIVQLAIERNENYLININNRCTDQIPALQIRQDNISVEYQYTQSMCLNLRNQIYIFNSCNCVSEILFWPVAISGNVQTCHQIPDSLINQLMNNVTANSTLKNDLQIKHLCHDLFMNSYNISNEQANCPVPCSSVTYSYDKSMIYTTDTLQQYTSMIIETLPGVTAKLTSMNLSTGQFDNLINAGSLSLKFCFITIIPKSSNVVVIREGIVYQIGNFFSDVGGSMGLFVGFTLITIFDLAELLIIIFDFLITECKKKNQIKCADVQ